MWQRFTERARKVVFYAQEEAQGLGDGYVSTEHLLLGLVRESDSVAASVLARLGIGLDDVRREVHRHLPRGETRSPQDMSLTPRAKRVIDIAYDEARNIGNNYIGTEHLLLGLIREGDGLASRVLVKLGAELDTTRRIVMELQNSSQRDMRMGLQDALRKKFLRPREVTSGAPVLHGQVVRLEPLSPNHACDLSHACDEHMFDFFPVYPKSFNEHGLLHYIAERTRTRDTCAYAIIDLKSGRAIGSTSFTDINIEHKSLEIGHTWIKKEFRGTHVNPEIKLLMLQQSFDVMNLNRVQLKTDARNLQSQAAIRKLGAKFEGAFRNNMVMPDGHLRTTHYFSIIPDEWPAVKAGLLRRLGRSE